MPRAAGSPLCGRTSAAGATNLSDFIPPKAQKRPHKGPQDGAKSFVCRALSHIFVGKADTQTLDTQRFLGTPKAPQDGAKSSVCRALLHFFVGKADTHILFTLCKLDRDIVTVQEGKKHTNTNNFSGDPPARSKPRGSFEERLKVCGDLLFLSFGRSLVHGCFLLACALPLGNGAPIPCCRGFVAKWAVLSF